MKPSVGGDTRRDLDPGKQAELTAVVLTRNEAENLPGCLATLTFASRILVVDSGSVDETRRIAREAGAEVVEHPFADFASQRNFALAHAETDWVLMIDADERVPGALAEEIARAVEGAAGRPGVAAHRIPRTTFYLGEPVRSGRDSVVRLLRKDRVRYTNLVHERPEVDGVIGDLATPLEHHTVLRLDDAIDKLVRYSELSARELAARGRRTGPFSMVGHILARLSKRYILRGAFRDGMRGLLLAGFEAAGVFLKYALLWERTSTDARRDSAVGARTSGSSRSDKET